MSSREAAKALARALATLLVIPALMSFWLRSRIMGRDRALESSSQAFALLPGLFGRYLRGAFLSRVLARCHHTATIEFGTLFSRADALIDENVYVGPRCHLGLVHIERDALLGPAVHVPSGASTHGFSKTVAPIREQPGAPVLVRIGAGSWIGSSAVIMADVGRDSVVGAGAVVTRPVPDRVIAGGVPARVLKLRE